MENELGLDYINALGALRLECKDWLFEGFIVEMCTQGMK